MRLLVTGGAGFIGSAVVRKAIADGHTVMNVDKLTYAANLDNLAEVDGHPAYQFVQADICDGPAMRELFDSFLPDAIMHLAAESHVDRSIDGPADFIETNIIGTFRLLEAARGYMAAGNAPDGFRFHHISTDEVFGSLGAEGQFTEESRYQPNSPYSASKASSDMLVRAWGETFHLPVVISNCSNNYGPCQFPEKLIPVVIMAARAGKPIPVYGKGENVRDWLHVNDHADALLLVAQKGVPGETYNVGGRAELRNIDLVLMICRELDKRFPDAEWGKHESLITHVTDRPGHDMRYAVDCSKIERELGWTPAYDVQRGISETVDWYLNNQDWIDRIHNRGFDGSRIGLGQRKAG
ncbi:dTDP-glucose 4,6-dehydratase [Hyphomonas adhaerens MHS-3]|uniref:dTDP-glucose 4,6-dehydratase n=1 Tax=Hyphomonas adhaerens MHS-3 TaxID=1280949 RepID=A0A069E9D7_9PROT|nr:dTDP-glucose 4,6-dehydratase [Hyphomonas adhaerens]KCZ85701.1 dTDP-glucose 4,6-dehydratase [Hyphomonas adhaerens MHS-3]